MLNSRRDRRGTQRIECFIRIKHSNSCISGFFVKAPDDDGHVGSTRRKRVNFFTEMVTSLEFVQHKEFPTFLLVESVNWVIQK